MGQSRQQIGMITQGLPSFLMWHQQGRILLVLDFPRLFEWALPFICSHFCAWIHYTFFFFFCLFYDSVNIFTSSTIGLPVVKLITIWNVRGRHEKRGTNLILSVKLDCYFSCFRFIDCKQWKILWHKENSVELFSLSSGYRFSFNKMK